MQLRCNLDVIQMQFRYSWVVFKYFFGWVAGEMGIKANLSQSWSWSWGWAWQKITEYDITVITSLNARGRPLKARSVKLSAVSSNEQISNAKKCGNIFPSIGQLNVFASLPRGDLKLCETFNRVFYYKFWQFFSKYTFLILRPLVNSSERPLRQIYVVCDRSSPKNWR